MSTGKPPSFISRALRGARIDAYHATLSRWILLIQSAKGLRKILQITEAVMMTSPEDRDKNNINYDRAKVINVIATVFDNKNVRMKTIQYQTSHGIPRYESYWSYHLPFGFAPTVQNTLKYLSPWLDISIIDSYVSYSDLYFMARERYHDATHAKFGALWLLLDEYLTQKGGQQLEAQFIEWALPICLEWLYTLTRLVQASNLMEFARSHDQGGNEE